jgi:RNA polymerase-associated protein CTR9
MTDVLRPRNLAPDDNSTINTMDYGDSLIIPIQSAAFSSSATASSASTTTTTNDGLFIEIFPEELKDIPVTTLINVLQTELGGASSTSTTTTTTNPVSDHHKAAQIYADAAVAYTKLSQYRDALAILQAGNEMVKDVRLLASTGIAELAIGSSGATAATSSSTDATAAASNEESRHAADRYFTQAAGLDTFFPMTWMGRGILNWQSQRYEQAQFFFNTTLKECGPVLPAILGNAAVDFAEGRYVQAQTQYAEAIRRYPQASGAASRVGFGIASYYLGQVDRAKAAFERAMQMDPENVPAMVGLAVLTDNNQNIDHDNEGTSSSSASDAAMKLFSMANLLQHDNAMVQNHLANHYFSKWTAIPGTVTLEYPDILKASQPLQIEVGDPVRIGNHLETKIIQEYEDQPNIYRIEIKQQQQQHTNNIYNQNQSNAHANLPYNVPDLKIWKKDYERVFALAKGAYSSTSSPEIRAESLFFLARVYHVRGEINNAHKCYERACKMAGSLLPARFGLAQTYLAQNQLDEAMQQLKIILGTATSSATDAYALLGLLRVLRSTSGGEINHARDSSIMPSSSSGTATTTSLLFEEGLMNLRKAMELDPGNPDLVLYEAMALSKNPAHYTKALAGYRKAVALLEQQSSKNKNKQPVSYQIYNNMGVLCHETKQYESALEMYQRALQCWSVPKITTLDNDDAVSPDEPSTKITVHHPDNHMFYDLLDTKCSSVFVRNNNNSNEDSNKDAGENENKDTSEPANNGGGSGTTGSVWTIQATESSAYRKFRTGEWVRIGDSFVTQVVACTENTDSLLLQVKHVYDHPMPDNDNTNNPEDEEYNESKKKMELPVFVLRESMLLDIDEVTTVAFNIARLHEAAGRTLAAIELHKALSQRNPAYVNSYLRLACIAVDCGSLQECAQWLQIAAKAAPGNSEVLTLIGNLHLSLCDWRPAQKVFDGLMAQKIPSVEAYSALSMGNIYFANLQVSEERYAKHLQYAADYYKRILTKDPFNAYAANGIGTVLAEKGEVIKAKEVFNRVREVSGDSIADALLNLGHIFLAQKKHPEALQLYKSYMKRAEDGTTPITSKSRTDDIVDVLLYIAFAYFDWARHTELFNDANAAPADGRYKLAMEHLELAISKNSKKDVILKYNLCMTKLQAANCVLQKLTRNIPRTVEEVEEALQGLEESLKIVEGIYKDKEEGDKKINIRTSVLEDFLKHCRANIASAQSHLEDERKRAEEERAEQEIRRLAAEAAQKEAALREAIRKQEEAKMQEERDRKAEAKMRKVEELRSGWQQEQEQEKQKKSKKKDEAEKDQAFFVDEEEIEDGEPMKHGLFDDSDVDDEAPPATANNERSENKASHKDLFGDTDDSDNQSFSNNKAKPSQKPESGGLFDDSDSEDEFGNEPTESQQPSNAATSKELFGDSDEDSDEELAPPKEPKRAKDSDDENEKPTKKQRVAEDDN